jgi:hypothetical protein
MEKTSQKSKKHRFSIKNQQKSKVFSDLTHSFGREKTAKTVLFVLCERL